ncbi:MAG: D-alanine--D-alanine ligase [Bacteroidales bacterium]|nr:D-alanine--D-alanine ligase [Bacteroidales bacterium]
MKNIAIVMGGYSGEHDISINSGTQVYNTLDHSKYNLFRIVVDRQGWKCLLDDDSVLPVDLNDFSVTTSQGKVRFDLAFILIHGNPGENGVLQGYFDMLGVKYTTSGFYTSSLTFNKGYCNPVVRDFGIVKVAKSQLLYKSQGYDVELLQENLRLPVFVKPASGGSSVATTKVKRWEDIRDAIEEAFSEAEEVMVEECIVGREFDCGVFRTKSDLLVFPITEIVPIGEHEFFDYEAKYNGFSNEITPAEVEEAVSKLIQQTSAKLYDLLNCKGIVRFDYIYDTDRQELYFLEVNTIPGQSAESIVPKQARAMGISTAELYDMAIEAALAES